MLLRCLLLHCKPSENSCVSRAHILLPLSHQLALAIPEPTKFNKRKNTFFWGFRQHLLKCSLCAHSKVGIPTNPFFPFDKFEGQNVSKDESSDSLQWCLINESFSKTMRLRAAEPCLLANYEGRKEQ